jgi:F-type H+-transporting ATPase subunit alpha
LGRGQRLTEILKQDQFAPFPVEKQVLSLFIATSGAIDSIPVPDIRRFESEFLQFVETSNPQLVKTIAEKKALDDSIKGEIKKAIDAFKERFAPAENKPGETRSAESKAGGDKSSGSRDEEKKTSENRASENQTTENKSAQSKAKEPKPA